MVKKIIMMQQRSTEQHSCVDLRRRLTNFKALVGQSMSPVLTTVKMLNQVFKVSSATCQQFAEHAIKISNIFWIFNFHKVVQQHIAGEVEIFVMCT